MKLELKKMITPVFALSLALTACSPKQDSSDDKVQIKAAASMEAEQLASAGEQLVSPYTFMLADKVLDMSLAKDGGNPRARFYKAVLKPFMVFQGTYKRLRPFVMANGDIKKFDSGPASLPESPAKDFLLNGNEDIRTVSDIQVLLDQYIGSLADLYKFLKDNENVALTLNLNPNVWEQQIQKDAINSCSVVSNEPGNINVVCDYRDLLQRKVGLADMIALRQSVAGMLMYQMLYNSYSLEGVEDLIKGDTNHERSPSEVMAMLDNMPSFGLLRSQNKLALLRTLGSDASAAYKYVRDHQGELCPSQKYPFEKRRKGFLFNDGVCLGGIRSEQDKAVALLDSALRGPISVVSETNGQQRNLRIDPFQLADRPVASLKSVFPASLDACGNATAFRDPSFGGILPDADGNLLIARQACRK